MSETGKASPWIHLLFFAAGFAFDAWVIRRIDDAPVLVQQGLYLTVDGVLLGALVGWRHRPPQFPAPLRWLPRAADWLLHFTLGTLLNAYALFYVKSASGATTILFFAVIALLLLMNELPAVHRLGPVVLYGLYSFCLTSYFAYLYPVLIGRIRGWMFVLAVATSAVPLALIGRFHEYRSGDRRHVVRHALMPAFGVQAALLVLYGLRLIPPVPLALMDIGIYHNVVREGADTFRVAYERPPWYHFWSTDDSTFHARPGDRIYCFMRVFAPRRFHDEVRVAWFYQERGRGWTAAGDLPIIVTGGRDAGFRGYAYKQNWRPGDWRVLIDTADGREIGRRTFSVESDSSQETREMIERER